MTVRGGERKQEKKNKRQKDKETKPEKARGRLGHAAIDP